MIFSDVLPGKGRRSRSRTPHTRSRIESPARPYNNESPHGSANGSPVRTLLNRSPVLTLPNGSPVRTPPNRSPVRTLTNGSPVRTLPNDSPVRSPRRNEDNSGDSSSSEDLENDYKSRGASLRLIKESVLYYLTEPGKSDKDKRYLLNEKNEIYLGENIHVPQISWLLLINHKPEQFIRDVATMIWKEDRILANRALQLSRIRNHIPNRSPTRKLEKNLLRLLISLFDDYLDRRSDVPLDDRARAMKAFTVTLSLKIRDCKRNEILKIRRQEKRRQKEERRNRRALNRV